MSHIIISMGSVLSQAYFSPYLTIPGSFSSNACFLFLLSIKELFFAMAQFFAEVICMFAGFFQLSG